MKPLIAALFVSYLVTWLSGIFNARQTRLPRNQSRMLHFSCTLVTCTILTILVVKVLF